VGLLTLSLRRVLPLLSPGAACLSACQPIGRVGRVFDFAGVEFAFVFPTSQNPASILQFFNPTLSEESMRHRFPMIAAALALLLCTAAAFSQAPTAPPKPGPEVKKMAALIGTWTMTFETKPVMGMPAGKGTSTETCVWAAGGFAVSCKENSDMGAMGKGTSISMMGYDAEAKKYVYSEISSDGDTVVSHGVVNGDTWVFENDSTMQGKPVHGRFTVKYTSKDICEIKFEMGPDANSMQLAMEGKQTRVNPAAPKTPAK
jgi:hypothetical protein